MWKLVFSIRKLLFQRRAEEDLDEETRFHLDMSIQEKIDAGLSEEEARLKSLRDFGGVEQGKEATRESWGFRLVHETIRDLRFGARMLVRTPVLSLLSICALAIGIGQVVTMFSIINGTILAQVPYKNGEELHTVRWVTSDSGFRSGLIQWDDYWEFRKQQTVFTEVAGVQYWPANVVLDEYSEIIRMAIMTPNLFRVLAVEPMLGPGFPDELRLENGETVVVISHSLWQERMAGASEVIGRPLLIGRTAYTITGVMPKDFEFPHSGIALWTLESQNPQAAALDGPARGAHLSMVVGRIKSAASVGDAVNEWNLVAQRLAQQFPDTNKELRNVKIEPLSKRYVQAGTQRMFWSMQAAAILVAVIACLNVAMLILASLFRRRGEFAVRSSLGASRRRICLQIVAEALLISTIGGACGLLLARTGSETVWRQFTENVWTAESWMHNQIDLKSLILVCTAVGVCAVTAGLLPALQVSKANVNTVLNQGDRIGSSRHSGKMLRIFSILQIGISCALLICTLFFIDIIRRGAQVPYPYDPDQILVGRVLLYKERYPEGPVQAEALRNIQNQLSALPGVRAVSFSTAYNPTAPRYYWPIGLEGESYTDTESMPHVYWSQVSQNYFEALEVPVLRGRKFNRNDTSDSTPVALVNTVFAERFWPGDDPIGKRFQVHRPGLMRDQSPWVRIIGIVPDLHEEGLENPSRDGACVYLPSTQGNLEFVSINLHTDFDNPSSLELVFRRTMASIDPSMAMRNIRTAGESLSGRYHRTRFIASIFGTFGISALILSAAGIFGIASFAVRARTREFGVRLALGAPRSSIARLILRQVGVTLGVGVVLGSLAGYSFMQLLSATFTIGQPERMDSYLVAAVVVIASGLLAILGPLLRATRVDPMTALREE